MRTLISHLRYTIRLLLKSPGFTITTILIMGLAIGANTAIFSLVDAVLLESLPYPDPGRLFTFRKPARSTLKYHWIIPIISIGERTSIPLKISRVFRRDNFNLTGNGDPERVSGAIVTASYFRVLGVRPEIGRFFAESEDRTGEAGVILLSDRFWRNRFAADPKIIGRTLVLNDVSYEVIGVAPPQIMNPENMDVYVPMGHFPVPAALTDRGQHPGLNCIGRLKPGVLR